MVSLLLQWIQHHTVIFEERKFPASYEEIEVRALSGWEAAFFSRGQAWSSHLGWGGTPWLLGVRVKGS